MSGNPVGSSPFPLVMGFLFSILFLLQIAVELSTGQSVTRDSSGGSGSSVPRCDTFDCGDGVQIGYPLWNSSESSTGYCGYRNLGIQCQNGHPVLGLGEDTYRVSGVNYETSTITLIDGDLLGSKCPRARHNLTLPEGLKDWLAETDADGHLLFFFNCSSGGSLTDEHRISCLPRKGSKENYVLLADQGNTPESYPRDCEDIVNSTVLETEVRLIVGNLLSAFGDVLHRGFQLKWRPYTTNCVSCERDRGSCGYAYYQDAGAYDLLCICNNGTHAGFCGTGQPGVNKRRKIVIGLAAAVGGLFLAGVLSFLVCQRRRMGVWTGPSTLLFRTTSSVPHSQKDLCFKFSNHVASAGNDISDVPLLDFKSVKAATSNFSDENKLGEGGFGPVYKGKLSGGDEVAVKRLSKLSKQGHQEFSNEVRLIAKLQHKNLVRLLGSCAHQDEKLLIYEYMPNKSLDKFIFDPRRSAELSWQKRFGIIEGIANGLLYLHHYSRMRVIHRDLKTSNILLDSEMNPKISDFGLARIFGADQKEANTGKVVGTFGYMSPEYASQGLFSEKSDVFSFGVILLEIITGERSTSFYPHKNSQTLLGYVWRMWEEGRALELLDPSMGSSPSQAAVGEVLKCTQLGLLCVQQDAAERPTMSYVVSSLSSETCVLPNPGQPAFANIGRDPNPVPSVSHHRASVNGLTLSSIGGR